MILTFPHMGKLHILLSTFFSEMGLNAKAPPPITKSTLAIGVRHSPETICLPFKIMLGNFIEALEQGADTVLTCGGTGPCRLGVYAQVQQEILNRLGYRFEMLVAEPSVTSVYTLLKRICPRNKWGSIYHALRFSKAKMNMIDELERRTAFIAPREKRSGESTEIYNKALSKIEQADSETQLKECWLTTVSQLEEVELKDNPYLLRIGLVGEIYVMLEPYVNQQLEKRLGEMGVEVHKTLTVSSYIEGHILHNNLYRKMYQSLDELARPYLGHFVGGHGLKSIAHTLQQIRENIDGMIQVYPFTCMPEVIAKNILPHVYRETGVPVLMLAYDEHSGEAGLITRLEAFVDLLRCRKKNLGKILH